MKDAENNLRELINSKHKRWISLVKAVTLLPKHITESTSCLDLQTNMLVFIVNLWKI